MRYGLLLVLLTVTLAPVALAQPLAHRADPPGTARAAAASPAPAAKAATTEVPFADLPVYYVVDRRPELRAGAGTGAVLGRLDFRRGVRVRAEQGPWRQVEDVETGARLGWVEAAALSNVWILMDKPSRTFYVYRGAELLRAYPADVSHNPEGDKVRRAQLGERDHYRIPEGTYFVTRRNPNSQYYRSFMLNYPNAKDAAQGLERGLISRAQYQAIVAAAERFESPPMGTALGGAIAIHGQGSGRRRAWTRGCVALRDIHMDALWDIIQVGTPVLIR
jgi:hypothetical protein